VRWHRRGLLVVGARWSFAQLFFDTVCFNNTTPQGLRRWGGGSPFEILIKLSCLPPPPPPPPPAWPFPLDCRSAPASPNGVCACRFTCSRYD